MRHASWVFSCYRLRARKRLDDLTTRLSARASAPWTPNFRRAVSFASNSNTNQQTSKPPSLDTALPSELDGNFYGLELTFLGTGAAAPSARRNVSSIALRIGLAEQRKAAAVWLFDVGEATQHQLCRSHLHMGRIERIFLTHLHGDHCFGLAGLLCGLGIGSDDTGAFDPVNESSTGEASSPKSRPLIHVYGPPGLRLLVRSALGVGRAHPRLRLCLHEIIPPNYTMLKEWYDWSKSHDSEKSRGSRHQLRAWAASCRHPLTCKLPPLPCEEPGGDYYFSPRENVQTRLLDPVAAGSMAIKLVEDERGSVYAAPLRHSVPCFGYVVVEKHRAPRLNRVLLQEKYKLGAHPLFKELKLGRRIPHPKDPDKWIEPTEVLLPQEDPRKVVILGDTYDSTLILPAARGCQLLVHEATLGDELSHRARSVQHSTARMAGEFAKKVGVTGALALTHISARYDDLEGKSSKHLLEEAKRAASNSNFTIFIAEDLQRIQVPWKHVRSKQTPASCSMEGQENECDAELRAVS